MLATRQRRVVRRRLLGHADRHVPAPRARRRVGRRRAVLVAVPRRRSLRRRRCPSSTGRSASSLPWSWPASPRCGGSGGRSAWPTRPRRERSCGPGGCGRDDPARAPRPDRRQRRRPAARAGRPAARRRGRRQARRSPSARRRRWPERRGSCRARCARCRDDRRGHRRRRSGASRSRSTSGGSSSTTASSTASPLADVPAATWAAWRADARVAPAGRGDLAELGARVRAACETRRRRRRRDVVVVTHVSPIKAAVAWALGVGDGVTWRLFVAPASMSPDRGARRPAVTPRRSTTRRWRVRVEAEVAEPPGAGAPAAGASP